MWFFLSFFMFMIAVFVHSIFARIFSHLPLVLGFVGISFSVALFLMYSSFIMFGFSDKALASILIYTVSCELYIFLFTLAANGVSVAILDYLSQDLTNFENLDLKYSAKTMVERRLHQLRVGGFLVAKNGDLALSPKGQKLVFIFKFLQTFFGHAHSSCQPNEIEDKKE